MADNIELNPGAGGDISRFIDKSGVKTPVVVLDLGGSGAEDLIAGTLPVSVISLPLPAGSATAANQATANASLASIAAEDFATENTLAALNAKVTAVNTGAVVVSSSALPSGASTAAKQDTGNTSIASVDTKTPALGQALAAASTPVVLTAAQVTTLTPPAAITNYAAETGGNLAAILAKIIVSPATEATLAAILAKILAAPATEAKQDTGNTALATLAGKDFSTQTTLAAVLAKIIASPATEAKQDTGNASLASIAAEDFATQTTLAALNAKVTAVNTDAVTITSMPPVAAESSATVMTADQDAGYTEAATDALTQTVDGRLRVMIAGLVSDVPTNHTPGENRSLSLTADGRLRVSSLPATALHNFWSPLLQNDADFGAGPKFYESVPALHAFSC